MSFRTAEAERSGEPPRALTLSVDGDPSQPASPGVVVDNLPPDLIVALRAYPKLSRRLRAVLRVRVLAAAGSCGADLPDVFGRHEVTDNAIHFIPHFPFEAGVRFRATFDPRPLGRTEVLHLDFCLAREAGTARAAVTRVFPSADLLPENLLRFYVCFSAPMQRGCVREHVSLLSPDGQPVEDALYRSPVELWNASMTRLTLLLDPGRIKRQLGPHRALGPPLRMGENYTLRIGAGMRDAWGQLLSESFCKCFRVIAPVREPVCLRPWRVLAPVTGSRSPLVVIFPRPLDRALLEDSLTIAPTEGPALQGRFRIDHGERRWSFTPKSCWAPGSYRILVAAGLEDVCGNNLNGAFDRALSPAYETCAVPGTVSFTTLDPERRLSRDEKDFADATLFDRSLTEPRIL
jgi:hypothetical protein